MTGLHHLLQLNRNEKWVIENSHITRVPKKPGQLKNVLDFNEVIKFTQQQLSGKTQNEMRVYIDHLTLKYQHIKQAIGRQNIITRLFLRLVLFVHGFDSHFQQLIAKAQKLPVQRLDSLPLSRTQEEFPSTDASSLNHPVQNLPLINSDRDTSSSNHIVQSLPLISSDAPITFKTKGGFANCDQSCFIATALHCLNSTFEALPKNIEQQTDESQEKFTQRKALIEHILKMLDTSNQNKTVSALDMLQLRKMWHAYDPSISKPGDGGNSPTIYRLLHSLFNLPLLHLIDVQEEERQSYKVDMLPFLNYPPSTYPTPFGEKGTKLEQETYRLTNHELPAPLKDQAPLFLPIDLPKKNYRERSCLIPLKFLFANSQVEYELVMCGIAGNGHYYCYGQGPHQAWIKYDDEQVSQHRLEDIHSDIQNNATMLIYQRKP